MPRRPRAGPFALALAAVAAVAVAVAAAAAVAGTQRPPADATPVTPPVQPPTVRQASERTTAIRAETPVPAAATAAASSRTAVPATPPPPPEPTPEASPQDAAQQAPAPPTLGPGAAASGVATKPPAATAAGMSTSGASRPRGGDDGTGNDSASSTTSADAAPGVTDGGAPNGAKSGSSNDNQQRAMSLGLGLGFAFLILGTVAVMCFTVPAIKRRAARRAAGSPDGGLPSSDSSDNGDFGAQNPRLSAGNGVSKLPPRNTIYSQPRPGEDPEAFTPASSFTDKTGGPQWPRDVANSKRFNENEDDDDVQDRDIPISPRASQMTILDQADDPPLGIPSVNHPTVYRNQYTPDPDSDMEDPLYDHRENARGTLPGDGPTPSPTPPVTRKDHFDEAMI